MAQQCHDAEMMAKILVNVSNVKARSLALTLYLTPYICYTKQRLSCFQLNGFELHCYNRSSVYRSLEKKFGLEPRLYGDNDPGSGEQLRVNAFLL